jgi:hypothetical protein
MVRIRDALKSLLTSTGVQEFQLAPEPKDAEAKRREGMPAGALLFYLTWFATFYFFDTLIGRALKI